ncbi:UNVERIFIED_CONTAM: Znf32 [Trichonephila clavipes]
MFVEYATRLSHKTKEIAHLCKICNKSFSQSGALNVHFRIHTKEKPHVCEICKRAFSQSRALYVHLRIHNKEKTYVCNICNKAFSESGALKKYLCTHNKGQYMGRPAALVSCEQLGVSFYF